MKKLELFFIRLCQRLPSDITLYEASGACTKPSMECEYCEMVEGSIYKCSKAPHEKPDIFKFT